MKKLTIVATLLTLAFSAHASRGGTRNLNFKNSMAGFASESVEHSMELLYRTNPAIKDQVVGANVEIISQADSAVIIELTDGSQLSFSCLRFDDWSRGGTVLKKEVACRQ